MNGELKEYIDRWGLVTQAPSTVSHNVDYGRSDGGDSLCESASYLVSLSYRGIGFTCDGRSQQTLWRAIKHWCVKGVLFRRHPDPWFWYRDWNRGTGDQFQNLIIAAGEMRDLKVLTKLFIGWLMRLSFCTNVRPRNIWESRLEHLAKSPRYKQWEWRYTTPDFRPFFIAIFIRSFAVALGGFGRVLYIFYPLLFLVDTFDLLVGAFSIKGSPHNYVVKTELARRTMPTPFSFLARKIYCYKFDPNELMKEHFSGLNPPLHFEWRPIINSWTKA